MSNTTDNKVSKRRNLVVMAVLAVILFLLPGISWYYLNSGFKWHKSAVAELGQYGYVRGVYHIFPGNEKVDMIDGSVCVIYGFGDAPDLTPDNKRILDDCRRLQDQFGVLRDQTVRPNFKLVMLAENATTEFRSYYQKFPRIDDVTWQWTGGGTWRSIMLNGYDKYCVERKIQPAKQYYALADTSGAIRRFYDAGSEKEITRMVEHIAMLLPKEQ